MKVRVIDGQLKGKELELATRQAEAAVAAGWAEFVDPRPDRPADVERQPVPTGSWLGPPGEAPAAPPRDQPTASWLGPPGEAPIPPPTGEVTGSWLGPPGENAAPISLPPVPASPGSWLGPAGELSAAPTLGETSGSPGEALPSAAAPENPEPEPEPDRAFDPTTDPASPLAALASSRKRGGSR